MTEKQKRVYDFIQAFIRTHGFAPSYTEIAKGLELRSKSNIPVSYTHLTLPTNREV